MGSWETFLAARAEWSHKTFGPPHLRGPLGPLKHLEKEVNECTQAPTDKEEYVDLLFLAFDAGNRAGFTDEELLMGCWAKLTKNENRVWPDWRTADLNAPIEHDRSKD